MGIGILARQMARQHISGFFLNELSLIVVAVVLQSHHLKGVQVNNTNIILTPTKRCNGIVAITTQKAILLRQLRYKMNMGILR